MKSWIHGAIVMTFHAIAMSQDLPQRQNDVIPPQVEQMYEKGLRFLSSKQTKEGCWEDSQGNEPGVVGLATIAFLAHGEDPNHGPYAKNIRLGIDFIISNQSSTNGYIGNSMYNHGFATLALAEAYGAIDHPKVAPSLKKAVELILSSQKTNPKKAWRYTPDARDADTTVSGCQIVALLAARNAGIAVPDEAIQSALAYMDKCRGADGGYGYTSSGGSRPTLTAIGSLCFSLAKKKDSKGFVASTKYLQNQINYREANYPYYLEYYMSQALFHADEKLWNEWNAKNIKLLATLQSPDGSWPGRMGYAFNTSGALLSLALNYRFLPIYEK
jgi:Prenyltransferase and squalene oxidase repeat